MAADGDARGGARRPRGPIGCTFGTGGVGVWMPLADALGMPLCDPTVWVANAKPFLIDEPVAVPDRRACTPSTSPEYAADYDEVKSLGKIDSAHADCLARRTPPRSGRRIPAANYNALARRFVDQFSLDVSDSARLFAMLDLSCGGRDHQRLERQVPLQLLAADHGDPAVVDDGNPDDGSRPDLDAAVQSVAAVRRSRRMPVGRR